MCVPSGLRNVLVCEDCGVISLIECIKHKGVKGVRTEKMYPNDKRVGEPMIVDSYQCPCCKSWTEVPFFTHDQIAIY